MKSFYDKQKNAHGGWATIVWLASGGYLFLTTPQVSIFSFKALLFLVVGMFAAAILFGGLVYFLQRIIATALSKTIRFPTPKIGIAVSFIGVLLLVFHTILVFIIAKWVFEQIIT